MLIHFLYRDEPTNSRFQSGLISLANKAKPALAAFELPLAQIARNGSRVTFWGELRAPTSGTTAVLERNSAGRWSAIATVQAGAGGYFRWSGDLPRGASVRLRADATYSATLTVR
jgi:hypothetical protein